MAWLLPSSLRSSYVALERYGLILVVVFVFWVPGVQQWLGSTILFLQRTIYSTINDIL
jgi:hypothetical protein